MSQPRSRPKLWIALVLGAICITVPSLLLVKKIGLPASEMGPITHIIQTGPDRRPLSSLFLQELLELSIDEQVSLDTFDCAGAEEKLLATHFVKEVQIKPSPPSTLYIDYTVRRPIAAIGDFENLAIDDEGVLFPISPYLTPKRLPEIYLGHHNFAPGDSIELPPLAHHLLDLFASPPFNHLDLLRIDLSNAKAPSLGRREVDLLLAHHLGPQPTKHLLRLSPSSLDSALENYLTLLSQLTTTKRPPFKDLTYTPSTVDLRIEGLAYLGECQL